MRGDQAITFLIFLTTGISMSNEEDFICEGKRGWYGIPLTCHHGTSNEKSTQSRLRILTKKLKVAEDDIAKIKKENLELKNKLATLESFVMPLKDESAPNRTDKCDVVTENFCFLTLVEKKWKMSFEDAVTACNKLGCTVANITNEAIYTRITSNLRRKIPNGWSLVYIWIGNQINAKTGYLPIPFTQWLQGSPKLKEKHLNWNNIYLIVDRNPVVAFQGMANIAPKTFWNGVVCQRNI